MVPMTLGIVSNVVTLVLRVINIKSTFHQNEQEEQEDTNHHTNIDIGQVLIVRKNNEMNSLTQGGRRKRERERKDKRES